MTVWERVGKEFGEILDSDPKIKNSDLKNETI